MRSYLAVLALLLSACFGQGNYLPAPISPTARNAKTTIAMNAFMRDDWMRSGYYRDVEDAARSYPVYAVQAGDGTVCIIDSRTMTLWREQDVVQCATQWRLRRP